MKEKQRLIRLWPENLKFLNELRAKIGYPVSLAYLANETLARGRHSMLLKGLKK